MITNIILQNAQGKNTWEVPQPIKLDILQVSNINRLFVNVAVRNLFWKFSFKATS